MENDIYVVGGGSISWSPDTLNPFHTRSKTGRTKDTDMDMDKNYFDARADLLTRVLDALNDVDGIRVLRSRDETEGPMGGKSAEVIGFSDDGQDGGLIAFAINIYADEKIEAKADRIVDAIKAEREKREAIFGDDA